MCQPLSMRIRERQTQFARRYADLPLIVRSQWKMFFWKC